jgi:hypothetical protein
VSIVSSFCVLLTAGRHGAEKNSSGARAADLPIVGQTLMIQVLMGTIVRDGDVMRLGRSRCVQVRQAVRLD